MNLVSKKPLQLASLAIGMHIILLLPFILLSAFGILNIPIKDLFLPESHLFVTLNTLVIAIIYLLCGYLYTKKYKEIMPIGLRLKTSAAIIFISFIIAFALVAFGIIKSSEQIKQNMDVFGALLNLVSSYFFSYALLELGGTLHQNKNQID